MYDQTVNGGQDIRKRIEVNKNFRNPSIYEKLVSFLDIDELGSNFPPEIFDPHKWGPESFYEELAKRQKEVMEAYVEREKRKDKTKVEILSGTKVKKSSDSQAIERKRTKWDNPPSQTSTASTTTTTTTTSVNSANLPSSSQSTSNVQVG